MRERGPTVAVLSQQIDDHLRDCVRERVETSSRLGRIEKIMIGIAGGTIVQLLAIVVALIGVIFSFVVHGAHP